MTVLPPEILDVIIDYNHDDKKTLAALSVVCKGCLPSARQHLFYKLRLLPCDTGRILDTLRSPGCGIAPCVQHLSMVGSSKASHSFMWIVYLVRSLAPLLPRLHTLRLLMTTFPRALLRLPRPIFILPSLKHLHMVLTRLQSPNHVYEIIRHHPLLESLHISHMRFADDSSLSVTQQEQIAPNLKAFTFRHTFDAFRGIDDLLIPRDDPSRDFQLGLTVSSHGDAEALERYVHQAGSSLHTLHLKILHDPFRTSVASLLPDGLLARNPRLRTLDITFSVYGTETTSWLFDLLRGTAVPLEAIVIEISTMEEAHLGLIDWHELDMVLVGQIQTLKKLVLDVLLIPQGPHGTHNALCLPVDARLPECHLRGLLSLANA